MLAFAYFFGIRPSEKMSTIEIFLSIGSAYVIGYALQEAFSLTPLLTTGHFQPSRFVMHIYKRFSNLKETPNINYSYSSLEAFLTLYPKLSQAEVGQLERTINLKQTGSAMGPSWMVSSAIIALKALKTGEAFDIVLASVLMLFACILLLIAWVKGVQQMHMFHVLIEASQKDGEKSDEPK